MQKIHYFIPLIALTFSISSVAAASPSPSVVASPSPTSSVDPSQVSENLKNRLKESLDNTTTESDSKKNLGYIGKVKDIIKDTLIVEDKDGKKDIKITDDSNIVRAPGNATIKQDNIRIGDYIIAIVTPASEDLLEAKRLIVSVDPINPPAKSTGIGIITKILKNSYVLSVDGSDKTLLSTTKTIFKSPVALIEQTELAVGDTLIYTAQLDDNDDLTATVIMRIKTAAISQ